MNAGKFIIWSGVLIGLVFLGGQASAWAANPCIDWEYYLQHQQECDEETMLALERQGIEFGAVSSVRKGLGASFGLSVFTLHHRGGVSKFSAEFATDEGIGLEVRALLPFSSLGRKGGTTAIFEFGTQVASNFSDTYNELQVGLGLIHANSDAVYGLSAGLGGNSRNIADDEYVGDFDSISSRHLSPYLHGLFAHSQGYLQLRCGIPLVGEVHASGEFFAEVDGLEGKVTVNRKLDLDQGPVYCNAYVEQDMRVRDIEFVLFGEGSLDRRGFARGVDGYELEPVDMDYSRIRIGVRIHSNLF